MEMPATKNSSDGGQSKNKLATALKKVMMENMASMAKGFNAVAPHMYGLEDHPMPSMDYPGFTLSLKDIPEAKDWKVGERYSLELVVEQTGMRDEIGQPATVDFSVIGIKAGTLIAKSDKASQAEKDAENNE